MSIIAWLVVGAIAGWLAGMLVKGDEGLGVIGHIVLGIVGAIVGGFLAGLLLPGNGDYTTGINFTTIITAVIGAVIAGRRGRPRPRRDPHRVAARSSPPHSSCPSGATPGRQRPGVSVPAAGPADEPQPASWSWIQIVLVSVYWSCACRLLSWPPKPDSL